jgi:hypothetical protein
LAAALSPLRQKNIANRKATSGSLSFRVSRIMVPRLLSVAALLLLLASRAQASSINLLLTTDYNEPLFNQPREIKLIYEFFQSPSNLWPSHASRSPFLVTDGATLLPGVTQFDISLNVESLDDVYFAARGTYEHIVGPRPDGGFVLGGPSLYAAHPPGGVSDQFVLSYGPPWISLADLDDGISGRFSLFLGQSRGPIGTWSLAAVPAPMAPVPEPASMLLLGSGLAAVAARKYRQSKAGRPID